MYFEQITTPGLGCFSYLIGCPLAGVMAVVDPKRDITDYIDHAKANGMRITHIFDTHVHADHVSGARELARATGAVIYLHESAQLGYEAKRLRHNDTFSFGSARVRVLHTPGHTPNSISLLVTDLARSEEPEMVLTGDLLFVGDTGRPDLPGEEILDEQIRNLFDSLNSTLGEFPDGLEVYPAHGQGSLCGGGMSAKPHSTLGYERKANPRLRLKDFDAFKDSIMTHLPMRPQSFSHIIATNMNGAPLLPLCENPKDKALDAQAVALLMSRDDVTLLDLRDSLTFAAAHIPGSIHVNAAEAPALNWIGTVVQPASRLVLILNNDDEFPQRLTELRRIGYDTVEGYLYGGLKNWIGKGWQVSSMPLITPAALEEKLAGPNPPMIVDVRGSQEFSLGHIDGAVNLPFDELLSGSACPGLPDTERVVVCLTGFRAAIASGILQTRGCSGISVLAGGYGAYKNR